MVATPATTTANAHLQVGCRLAVYWAGDDAWYEGKIQEVNTESGYFVHYDDGEEQWEVRNLSLTHGTYVADMP